MMIYKDQNMNICSMNKSEQNFMVFSVEILVELIKMGRSE